MLFAMAAGGSSTGTKPAAKSCRICARCTAHVAIRSRSWRHHRSGGISSITAFNRPHSIAWMVIRFARRLMLSRPASAHMLFIRARCLRSYPPQENGRLVCIYNDPGRAPPRNARFPSSRSRASVPRSRLFTRLLRRSAGAG